MGSLPTPQVQTSNFSKNEIAIFFYCKFTKSDKNIDLYVSAKYSMVVHGRATSNHFMSKLIRVQLLKA